MEYPVSDAGSLLQNGRFTDGNSSTGIPASIDKAAHMNAVYDEIINAITGLGLAPSESNVSQLLQGINIAAPKSQITFHYVDINDSDPVPGWVLCNGANGAPDLRDRYVVGAGSSYPVGTTGGAATKTTSTQGSVTPTITVNNHTLTESQLASHDHAVGYEQGTSRGSPDKPPGGVLRDTKTINTDSAGGNLGHNHTATSSAIPSHSHAVDVRPPYFALAPFIRADYLAEIVAAGGL